MDSNRCPSCMQLKQTSQCPHCGYPAHGQNKEHQLPVGTLLRGRYQIGKVLGQGGFGITYLAWDEQMHRTVAVKEFFPTGSVFRDCRESAHIRCVTTDIVPHYEFSKARFLREAQALVRFQNIPVIVDLLDFVEENNTAYIIMEYVRGVDLAKYIQRKGGSLSVDETFRILRPVMEALAKVHRGGIVHRDISPDNIILDPMGGAKLLDFGAVRSVENPDVNKSLTRSTEAILKHGFAPMEQYNSRGSLGPWTDEYAMCATVWYCLTGRIPEEASVRMTEGVDPDWASIPGLAKHQQKALRKGFSCRPKDRFPDMDSLINALFRKETVSEPVFPKNVTISAEQAPVQSVPPQNHVPTAAALPMEEDSPEESPRPVKKKTVLISIAATAVALIVASTVVLSTPAIRYRRANALLKQEKYAEAGAIYDALGDYEDSGDQAAFCTNETKYLLATQLMEQKAYIEAAQLFEALGDYKDSAEKAILCRNEGNYLHAMQLMEQGQYIQAAEVFAALGSYKDSEEMAEECRFLGLYTQAEAYLGAGDYYHAATGFYAVRDFRDAWERSLACWDHFHRKTVIGAGTNFTVGLRSDGTVVAAGKNDYGQCNVSGWQNIVAVSAGNFHTVGLKADGSVVAVGNNNNDECDVTSWQDIVAISAGLFHTVGLKADGTVVAVGNTFSGQCSVGDWSDIVAISAGDYFTVGLKADGTVVAAGSNGVGQCDVSAWRDIVAIEAGACHAVGIRADGSVVVAGCYNDYSECVLSGWQNITKISASGYHTVGILADGSVVAHGNNAQGRCDVSGWQNIVAVISGTWHTVGVTADGQVLAVGKNDNGQCDVSGWTDIQIPG